MHAPLAIALVAQAVSLVAANPLPRTGGYSDIDRVSQLAHQALVVSEEESLTGKISKRQTTCTPATARVRREWSMLSGEERIAYTDAVQCLQQLPSRIPEGIAPGAKSRYDDFVATHMNQTMQIHETANFLSWHRHFLWVYENALRDECGYTGTQPYWDWGLTAITGWKNSPLFDGSETSLSGNGEYVEREGGYHVGSVVLPTNEGGGCVQSGPFKDMTVNLGPVGLVEAGNKTGTVPDRWMHNPRCLTRDFSDFVVKRFANATATLFNILQPTNIQDFQTLLQGDAGHGELGIHGGGHFFQGGNPSSDVFTSPGDPIFYMHHAMVDRVWWIWQNLDPAERIFSERAIAGTRTYMNNPASEEGTLEDLLEFEYAAQPPVRMGDVISSMHGAECFVYL